MITLQITVHNRGAGAARSEIIRVYRHAARTANPIVNSARIVQTAQSGSLAAGASATRSLSTVVPSVTSATTYYYYACVDAADGESDTGDNCSGPAEVRVQVVVEEQALLMGGGEDQPFIQYPNSQATPVGVGTITLGGLETADGTRGFVVSAHTVDARTLNSTPSDLTDVFLGRARNEDTNNIQHLLGKILKMPPMRTEGGKEIVAVDAAFVRYPQPQRSDCSIEWKDESETFCFDDNNQDDYIERISPLAIRGKNDSVYQVIGSKRPTAGLKVTYSGAVSGPHGNESRIVGGKILAGYLSNVKRYDMYQYVYQITPHLGPRGGDSGSPIYTVPDTNKNVYIVGVHKGKIYINRKPITVFSSWSDIADAFNLKPITQ